MAIDFDIPADAKAMRERVRQWVQDECIPAEKRLVAGEDLRLPVAVHVAEGDAGAGAGAEHHREPRHRRAAPQEGGGGRGGDDSPHEQALGKIRNHRVAV